MKLYSLLIFFACFGVMYAQSLEPRLYSNAAIGTNFLIAGYDYSSGGVSLNPISGFQDPSIKIQSGVLAYAKIIDILGDSGKVDIVIPSACIKGSAVYNGSEVNRDICGMGDIKGRISWSFYGAPAVASNEFKNYEQDVVLGTSVQITTPSGQYDQTKLLNVGANRWAIKPGVGVSKKYFSLTAELNTDVEFYSDNNTFYTNIVLKQKPIYSVQSHLIYNFTPKIWTSLNANYYWGGETSKGGVWQNDSLDNSRIGMTLGLPIYKTNSLKLYASRGISTRYGTNFDRIGIAWQYYWIDSSTKNH